MKAYQYTAKQTDGSEKKLLLSELEATKLQAALTKDLFGTEEAVNQLEQRITINMTEVADLSQASRELMYLDREGDLWRFNSEDSWWEWNHIDGSSSEWRKLSLLNELYDTRAIGPFKVYRGDK